MPLADWATLLGFVLAAGAVVVSPGPDTMLLLRTTMAGGTRLGMATLAGIQLGLVGHTALAVGGLSLVIVNSPLLFKGIALAGAIYLAWLAVDSVRAGVVRMEGGQHGSARAGRALRDALLTNLLNPKVILLYLALMPNFVAVETGDVPVQLAFLGVVLIVINVAWQVPLCLAAEGMRRWLGTPSVQRAVNWVTGAILLTFAAVMLWEHLL